MKGIVFTEFFNYVEREHSPIVLQQAIDGSGVASGGVYTATGTYPASEMFAIVGTLSKNTGQPHEALLHGFGRNLFETFAAGFPQMFEGVDDAFDFIASVEECIHVEVRKLYPDAELPSLKVTYRTDDVCHLVYTSSRHMGDFCEGLLRGCLDHFGETARITREAVLDAPGAMLRFTIDRSAA